MSLQKAYCPCREACLLVWRERVQPLPRSMEKPCNRRALALKRVRWEQGGGEGEMGISKRREEK